jgi:hypothetical protein
MRTCPVFQCSIKVEETVNTIIAIAQEGVDLVFTMKRLDMQRLLYLLQDPQSGFTLRGGRIWGTWYLATGKSIGGKNIVPAKPDSKFARYAIPYREDLGVELQRHADNGPPNVMLAK